MDKGCLRVLWATPQSISVDPPSWAGLYQSGWLGSQAVARGRSGHPWEGPWTVVRSMTIDLPASSPFGHKGLLCHLLRAVWV